MTFFSGQNDLLNESILRIILRNLCNEDLKLQLLIASNRIVWHAVNTVTADNHN
jgi:hypothetical protein